MFGRGNTNPVNQGLAWLIAGLAKTRSPDCVLTFGHSKSKFTSFPALCKIDAPIKMKSIFLAKNLLQSAGIDPAIIFKDEHKRQWEHLADAIGLGFCLIKSFRF